MSILGLKKGSKRPPAKEKAEAATSSEQSPNAKRGRAMNKMGKTKKFKAKKMMGNIKIKGIIIIIK